MIFPTFIAALALTGLIAATPLPDADNTKCTKTSYVDKYDDLNAANNQDVGTYNGLNYQVWKASKPNVGQGTTAMGVQPQSSPNGAAVNYLFDMQAGASGAQYANPYGTISIDGTKLQYFAVKSFFFGCLNFYAESSTTRMPVACTITVFGYDANDNQKREKAFNYAPVNGKMEKAVLPAGYNKLQNVTIAVSTSTTTPQFVQLVIDNLSHVNCE